MVKVIEDGRVDMVHGTRFLEQYPKYREVLEKLYLKRELDNWYIGECRKTLVLPNELFSIKNTKVKIQDGFNPSVHVYLTLEELSGEGGFSLVQEIQLTISKIIPVYNYVLLHKINHSSLDGILSLVGPANSFSFIELEEYVNEIMRNNGYQELSDEYDMFDTVYEWDKLSNIEPVNRRLILKDALFVDILELCGD